MMIIEIIIIIMMICTVQNSLEIDQILFLLSRRLFEGKGMVELSKCFKEHCPVLVSITQYYSVLLSITQYYLVLAQNVGLCTIPSDDHTDKGLMSIPHKISIFLGTRNYEDQLK